MKSKRRVFFRLGVAVVGIALLRGIFFIVRSYISSADIPAEFKITTVDRGPVVLSEDAKGVVVPGNEVVLLSPASSVITSIVKPAGSRVRAGEIILKLDPRIISDNIESLEDQLEIKRNDLLKNKLNARSTTIDLNYNVEVKKLGIASLKSELADQEQLLGVGGISPAQYEKTKQELNLAEKELQMVLEKNSIRLQQL